MEQTQQSPVESAEQKSARPSLPSWPTSKRGPKVTEPPVGQRRMPQRTEQVVEIDYDQVQGKSHLRDGVKKEQA
jgi:hypothetical protein